MTFQLKDLFHGFYKNSVLDGCRCIREGVKYYFADFVRKGGEGVPPKSVTPFSLEKKSVKGGGGYPLNP